MTQPNSIPKSEHLTDPLLRPFISTTFSPTTYLNTTLPPLPVSQPSRPSTPKQAPTLSLSDITSQTQSQITNLNAHLSRLSTTLTDLTTSILRTSTRLTYEVELLRGETLDLSETMTTTLHDPISKFIPNGLSIPPLENQSPIDTTTQNPEAISHLRTLLLVRSRLASVLRTFDLALSFPLPPTLTNSLISVSAPPTTTSQAPTSQTLRDSIAALLSDPTDPQASLEKAAERVSELREVVGVWKGTLEEKPRTRFVEGLEGMVEERSKELGLAAHKPNDNTGRDKGDDTRRGSSEVVERGPGFLRNLQRLREEIYLD